MKTENNCGHDYSATQPLPLTPLTIIQEEEQEWKMRTARDDSVLGTRVKHQRN